MELKPYQQDVIRDLESYLSYLNKYENPAKAYNTFWADKVGEYNPITDTGMKPYKDNIPGAVHIAIKVPTAGGKTFIACNALHTINKQFSQGNTRAVVWLVPWSNLLQQTYNNLNNPNHPYREKLNSLFGHKVEVYQKDQLIQGANFNPTSVTEQLNIFVLNFSSLRIDKAKKEDRKIFQENGALEPFRNLIDKNVVLEDTEETALINVIRSLNPVVIVDESHNAESDLSVEMLRNLNPSLILDLTATPKQNSNIISFVSALKLKQENMVKLPVVVYNHHKKEEVINNALHLQRQLELVAEQEALETGKYIRPIILFQAQSNIKGKDNTTFQNIKEQLVKLKIPEEQIKIKVSNVDELKGIDLMDKNCPVRYIITVNALKEGWDCPNAYILASLADKSSAVEVEQILGRVLRQPYVTKHKNPLLNMSFVLTASSKFNETIDNIVKGLQDSGFSTDDYYAEELPEPQLTNEQVLQQNLFESESSTNSVISDDDFNVAEISFNPDIKMDLETYVASNPVLTEITQKATKESIAFEEKVKATEIDETTTYFTELMKKTPPKYKLDVKFKEVVSEIALPQFFIKTETEELQNTNILFEELTSYDTLLNKNSLLKGFNLLACDTKIDFNDISADIVGVDYDESKKKAVASKFNVRAKSILIQTILAKPKQSQIKDVTSYIVNRLGDQSPIPHQDLNTYVNRVFESLTTEQISDVINNEFIYVQKLKEKINKLTANYSKERFRMLLDANAVFVKSNFSFPESISPIATSTAIGKSLYEAEDTMNGFEQDMIMELASLSNVLFWHRNLNRGKGFFINGYYRDHYPDFIINTKSGNIVIIETKGDHLDNDDSTEKNDLGKVWAEKCGNNFKYFMVFQTKQVKNCYTAKSIIEVLKML